MKRNEINEISKQKQEIVVSIRSMTETHRDLLGSLISYTKHEMNNDNNNSRK